jgi:alkylated DNA repair dioxygenase AlkB
MNATRPCVTLGGVAPGSRPLFDRELPDGFRYQRDLITPDDERSLLQGIGNVEFSAFEMRGAVARRRVAFFGRSYDAGRRDTPPLPAFLLPLRDRVAEWTAIDPSAFAMALINEYPPGAPIGWHRDAPQYDIVAGISLLSACRMKFRPYLAPGASVQGRCAATHEITLEPRSGYVMAGESRARYEHHIPAVAALRYSITFRTLR